MIFTFGNLLTTLSNNLAQILVIPLWNTTRHKEQKKVHWDFQEILRNKDIISRDLQNTNWDIDLQLNIENNNKKIYGPFLWWGSTASRLEPFRGGSLLSTTKFPKVPGTHFIDLKDEQLSWPWSHPVVSCDWESSALTTRPLLLNMSSKKFISKINNVIIGPNWKNHQKSSRIYRKSHGLWKGFLIPLRTKISNKNILN